MCHPEPERKTNGSQRTKHLNPKVVSPPLPVVAPTHTRFPQSSLDAPEQLFHPHPLGRLKVGNEFSKGAGFMKKLLAVIAVFALSLAVMAQSGSQPSDQSSPSQSQTKPNDQSQSNPSSATGQSNQKMTGTVSKDGKSFTNDSDNKKYKVNNPDALSGHEGQQVSLILAVDPDTNTIHIIQVGGPQ
jgi:hypothetical protein